MLSPTRCDHGIDENMSAYSNDLGHLLLFIIVSPRAGAFRRHFTTNLAQQCSAFSRTLKIERLIAPLFCEGLGDSLQVTGALHSSTIQRIQRRLL